MSSTPKRPYQEGQGMALAGRIIVREATAQVALSVLPLIPEFDPDDGPKGSWTASAAARLSGEHLILIAITGNDESTPAGMLIAYDRYEDGSLYCWLAAVVPAARRHGALSALMSAMTAWAREHGYEAIRIGTQNRFRGMLTYLVRNDYDIVAADPREPASLTRITFTRKLP